MQSTKPHISILMLTYNRAHFLPEAIQSVLKQTYQNWELIVIDDGSTDKTAKLMAGFADPRIHYIRHESNAGLFVRRAESLSYAKGTYTAILDSDDCWTSPNKLDEQVAFLESNPEYVLIGTMATLVDDKANHIGEYRTATTDDEIRAKILTRNQCTHSSLLIRTSALLKTAGYQATLAEDLELVLALGTHGKLANLPQLYTAHRVHRGSQNDHGLKMARAVDRIITSYAHTYPNPFLAKVFSKLRLLRGYLK
jgi:glycosyltransferase involved in cell wall biosynthesis